MATVEFRGIHKSYGTTHVVRGVDLVVEDGEFVVLVGPSGCGKSTMLRMIAGLEAVTTGQLLIGGEVVNDRQPRDRDVAMVFQSYALYPHMTVRRNLAFALEVRRTPRREVDERVAEAARMLGLSGLLDRYPKQLSGGQRQRVAIGRAIVRRPKVFLFDEPLSNLDASLRSSMRVELARLHRSLGTTMVYVTHDQVEAMTLADRIALLNEGLIQQVGAPAELYDRPANRFVASFIGSPSMNFLDAELLREGDGIRVEGEGFSLAVAEARAAGATESIRKVVVGIRPHDLKIRRAGADTTDLSPRHVVADGPYRPRPPAERPGTISAAVDVIEPMGWEALVYLAFGGRTLVAHAQAAAVTGLSPGDRVDLEADPEQVHLFDAATERSLAGA